MRARPWRGLRSVRGRTTALAALLVALTLVAGAVVLVASLTGALVRGGDTAALTRVRDVAELAAAGALPVSLAVPADDDLVQVVAADGTVLAAGGVATRAVPVAPGPSGRPAGEPTVTTVDLQDAGEVESYRVWSLTSGSPDGPVAVHIGTSLERVGEATAVLRGSLAVGVPAALALLVPGLWVVIGRALRPVEAMRAEVAEISGGRLDRRVPVPGTGDEVARLGDTMNAMLDRLEAAARRQREFVADASHELQSPLAAFRAHLEVSLAHPAGTDWPAVARDLLADSDAMERVVGDLLYLARADATPPAPQPTLVDLDDIVLDEAGRLRSSATLLLDTSGVSAAPVRGSAEELRRLVRNGIDNAVQHARSVVRLRLGATTDEVVLAVEDDGPGVPPDDRERVFERFVRLDGARTRGRGGTGLGLAIVRAVALRHGGTARVEDRDDGTAGARLVVRLPAPGDAPQGGPPG